MAALVGKALASSEFSPRRKCTWQKEKTDPMCCPLVATPHLSQSAFLNPWATEDHWKTQIFTLQFITIAKLQLKVAMEIILWLGAYHTIRNCIKGA